jgi:hypothetical protein
MEKITIENKTTIITLEPDKFINDDTYMDLVFKNKNGAGQAVIAVTIQDLEAIEKAITELRNQLTLKKLEKGILNARTY